MRASCREEGVKEGDATLMLSRHQVNFACISINNFPMDCIAGDSHCMTAQHR
jgi:hypothetical protein